MKLDEHLARVEASHHYAKRFGKPASDPHVRENVDANWNLFEDSVDRLLDELAKLGIALPATVNE